MCLWYLCVCVCIPPCFKYTTVCHVSLWKLQQVTRARKTSEVSVLWLGWSSKNNRAGWDLYLQGEITLTQQTCLKLTGGKGRVLILSFSIIRKQILMYLSVLSQWKWVDMLKEESWSNIIQSIKGDSRHLCLFLPRWHQACPDDIPSQGSGKLIAPMVGWSAPLKRIWLVSSFLLKMPRDCFCKGVQSGERGFVGIDGVIY